MTGREQIDLGLKVLMAAIAFFGVWKYFADRSAEALADAKARSLGYIERFADKEIVNSRAALVSYWRQYPEFAGVDLIDRRADVKAARVDEIDGRRSRNSDRRRRDELAELAVDLGDDSRERRC